MHPVKYSKEALEQAVRKNISLLGTMRTLGVPLSSGGLRNYLRERIKYYGIDTSHFLGMGWNTGKGVNHKGGVAKKIVKPNDERKCSKCGESKLADEFYSRESGQRKGEYYEKCIECMKERGIEYFHKNHKRQYRLALLRREKYRRERKVWLDEIKNKPCMDCGNVFPSCAMDFDHRDGVIKVGSISRLAFQQTANWNRLKEEIRKCDLVCANCHRVRTYDRIQKRKFAAVAKLVTAGL